MRGSTIPWPWFLLLSAVLSSCSLMKKNEAPADPKTELTGWEITCKTMASVNTQQVCVHRKGVPTKTVIAWHGAGCNEKVFQFDGCLKLMKKGYIAEREYMKTADNVVLITLSFAKGLDSIYLLDPISPKKMAGPDETVDVFFKRTLPELEALYNLPKPYHLMGHSMGGFNAAEILLDPRAQSVFSSAVLMAPMLATCDLFSGEIVNENCWPDHMVRAEFPKAKWPKVNPLELIKTADLKIPTLVQYMTADEFKLVDGPELFVAIGQRRGLPVTGKRYEGGTHYVWNATDALVHQAAHQ